MGLNVSNHGPQSYSEDKDFRVDIFVCISFTGIWPFPHLYPELSMRLLTSMETKSIPETLDGVTDKTLSGSYSNNSWNIS